MLVTGRWEARNGLPGRTLDLRGSRTQVPLELAERRLESERLDLFLEIGWANNLDNQRHAFVSPTNFQD